MMSKKCVNCIQTTTRNELAYVNEWNPHAHTRGMAVEKKKKQWIGNVSQRGETLTSALEERNSKLQNIWFFIFVLQKLGSLITTLFAFADAIAQPA